MTMISEFHNGLVINLHYTEACNYRCRQCYARFGVTPLRLEDWKRIIDNISNSVVVRRFNLAGGEPLACSYIQQLVGYIHSLGIDCSIITNGSLLTPDFIRKNQDKLSMIGISVDAFSHEDNVRLGRVNTLGKTLSVGRLQQLAKSIHAAGMTLKINTVVNAVNASLDFTDLIGKLAPDRWKLLRMVHIEEVNDSGADLLVSDEQFAGFVRRHQALSPEVEDTDNIINSYIFVNPHGQLVNNFGGRYKNGKSLLDHPFITELRHSGFNLSRYLDRYHAAA